MNLSITAPTAHVPDHPSAGRLKAEKAARDFESVLLGSLLDSLQKTVGGTPGDNSAESQTYASMGTQALASAMAERGGIGIAQMILRQWQHTKVLPMG